MNDTESPLDQTANAAAEEVLRIIYGDDLQGCAVRPDSIAAVIRSALEGQILHMSDVTELHTKGFEAVQLLATPPADGHGISVEDLRSLLGKRLDDIRALATTILNATRAGAGTVDTEEPSS